MAAPCGLLWWSAARCAGDGSQNPMHNAFAWCTVSADSGWSGRLAVGDGMCGHSRLAGGPVARASLLLRCCGDVAVSNDVTPFRIVATILLLRGRRQIYSFCCVTTITPQMQLDDGYLVH